MKIKKLTIDEGEIIIAVQAYLETQGIKMPVHSVSKEYRHDREYEVTFQFEVDETPIVAAPATNEESL